MYCSKCGAELKDGSCPNNCDEIVDDGARKQVRAKRPEQTTPIVTNRETTKGQGNLIIPDATRKIIVKNGKAVQIVSIVLSIIAIATSVFAVVQPHIENTSALANTGSVEKTTKSASSNKDKTSPTQDNIKKGESIVLQGIVVVGEDLDAGTYLIESVDYNSDIYIYPSLTDLEKEENDIDWFWLYNKEDEGRYDKIESFVLKEGYAIQILTGPARFTKVK